jgi:hypothetical protein
MAQDLNCMHRMDRLMDKMGILELGLASALYRLLEEIFLSME